MIKIVAWIHCLFIHGFSGIRAAPSLVFCVELVSSSDNKSVSHWIMFDYFFHV